MGKINSNLCEMHIISPECDEKIINAEMSPAFREHKIASTGITRAVAEFRFVRPRPRARQILACLSGWGMVWVDGKWVRCTPGRAYLTPIDSFHAYHAVEGVCWEFCWIMYTRGFQTGPLSQVDRPTLITVNPQQFAVVFTGLYNESRSSQNPIALSHWSALLHLYAQRMLEPPSIESRLRPIWEEVEHDLAHRWTLQQLAERANVTPEHLRRLCKRQFGMSPMQYVTHLRMRQASILLASDFYSIETVARKVGYDNPFAFSTAFKRCMGLSPSEYRARRA